MFKFIVFFHRISVCIMFLFDVWNISILLKITLIKGAGLGHTIFINEYIYSFVNYRAFIKPSKNNKKIIGGTGSTISNRAFANTILCNTADNIWWEYLSKRKTTKHYVNTLCDKRGASQTMNSGSHVL